MAGVPGKKYLLGFDMGGAGLKLGIFTGDGIPAGFGHAPNTIISPGAGMAEISPGWLWQGFLKTLQQATRQAGISPADISSVGVSTTCPTLIPLDDNGKPLRNAIMNFDQRSAVQARRLSGLVGEERVLEITGNRLASGAVSVPGMVWVKENEPEIYGNTVCFGHSTTFLVHKLTGKLVMDWTNASLTGLFETGKGLRWSQELSGAFGIPADKLPLVMRPTEVAGTVTGQAARETGLRAGIPVSPGSADTACSSIGMGITGPGQVFVSSGTSEIVTFCSDKPEFDSRFLNRAYVAPGLWLSHGAMNTAGAGLRWFRDNFCAHATGGEENGTADDYGMMADCALKSKPGANGVIFLPYLQGERTPLWDPYARGVFFGMSLSTTKDDLARAVLEGTAYALRMIVDIAEEVIGEKIPKMPVTGGGTKNRLWQEIKCDVLGKRLMTARFAETATLGAALLGGISAGVYRNYREAISRAVSTELDAVEPDHARHLVYSRYYDIFRDLYPSLKDAYRQMSSVKDSC